MILNAILIFLGIVLIIGIIRVIINPVHSFGEFIIDILFIDLLGDLLSEIIDAIDWD
jgi:hypothetical protein